MTPIFKCLDHCIKLHVTSVVTCLCFIQLLVEISYRLTLLVKNNSNSYLRWITMHPKVREKSSRASTGVVVYFSLIISKPLVVTSVQENCLPFMQSMISVIIVLK